MSTHVHTRDHMTTHTRHVIAHAYRHMYLHICIFVCKLTHGCSLNLRGNTIGHYGAGSLERMLRTNTCLTSLDVSSARLYTRGGLHMAKVRLLRHAVFLVRVMHASSI